MKAGRSHGRCRAAAAAHGTGVALLLAACASAPPTGAVGIDGIACALPDQTLPAALHLLPDAAMPRTTEGASGQGGICRGRIYETRVPLALHRLWEAERGNELGHWWTLQPPAGGRADYRRAYAVCETWNALDRAVTCTLAPGARVVVGSGQSATCAEASYAKSSLAQVYVLPDPGSGVLPLADCRARPFP